MIDKNLRHIQQKTIIKIKNEEIGDDIFCKSMMKTQKVNFRYL